MSHSIQEEILAALHVIVTILCVHEGYTILAWAFGLRAVFDTAAAISFGIKSLRESEAQ